MLELAERLKADAPKIAAAMLRGVERRPIHPPRESVEEAVERLRGALEGRVALAFLHGGRARGYALRGDYDVAVLMEQGCDLYKLGELVVDAAEAARAPFSLLLDVLGRGKVVYCRDEDELFEDKLRAIKMYDDWLNFSKYFIEREIKKVTG